MITRIRIQRTHRSISDWVEVIAYEVLSGDIQALPQDVLAQSESTGAIWSIHRGKIAAKLSDGGAVSMLAPLSLAPEGYGTRIFKGEVLKIVLVPTEKQYNDQIENKVGIFGASEGRLAERHTDGYFQCPVYKKEK